MSLSDDELTATALIPSKTGGGGLPAPRRPATVPPPRPATVPPSGPASVPQPARMARSAVAASFNHDDPKGRVRGAPRVVKRASAPPSTGPSTGPTTFSPAAVIKATLESARAQEHNGRLAGPPVDLVEDADDVHHAGAGAPVAMGAQELQPQPIPHSAPPAASYPPPSPSYPAPSSAFPPPPASYPYGVGAVGGPPYAAPVASGSVPGVSVPPHFMVVQAPYSDGRVDPPATSITWSHGVAGRSAMSWALALLAFGLFVGVGAVALTQRSSQGLAETTASFVDPARAPGGRAAPQRRPQPMPVAVPAEPAAHFGVVVAAPAVPPPTVAPLVGPATAAALPAAPQPVAAAAPAPQPVAVAQPEPPRPPPPVVTFKPPPRTWSPPSQPKPAARPADDSAVETKKTAKKGGSKGGDDDEMKKALEQLQKSQLERSLGE